MMQFFQDDDSPIHTPRSVQSWCEEHEDALHHLLWLAQSPNLNIIKPLVSFREQGEKQISSTINQATRRRVVQYFTRDYSKHTSCVTCHWWPNSILTAYCSTIAQQCIIYYSVGFPPGKELALLEMCNQP
jgi:hypothetical protein